MNKKLIFIVISCMAILAIGFLGTSCAKEDKNKQVGAGAKASPEVIALKWGEIKVRHADDTVHTYKDAKIFPSGSKEWNWKLTGTEHVPGIQIADTQELLDADVFILSRGMDQILQVMPETIQFLKEHGKEVHVEQTEEAVKLYNKLVAEGKKVAALIHSTC